MQIKLIAVARYKFPLNFSLAFVASLTHLLKAKDLYLPPFLWPFWLPSSVVKCSECSSIVSVMSKCLPRLGSENEKARLNFFILTLKSCFPYAVRRSFHPFKPCRSRLARVKEYKVIIYKEIAQVKSNTAIHVI